MEEALYQCIDDMQHAIPYSASLRYAGVPSLSEFRHMKHRVSSEKIAMLQARAISWCAKEEISDAEMEKLAEMLMLTTYTKYLIAETCELDACDLSTLFGDATNE